MLARINKRIGKMVFCYLNGRHSIPLVLPIVRGNPDVEFYFHSRTFAGVDFMASPLAESSNAHFVGDFDELKFKLNLFGAFITTDANAAHSHVYSLKLMSMFRALGIPALELQHGLFQIGLHYYDVPSGVSFWGDSLPSKSFAERILAFYPPIRRAPPSTVIGYPPYSGELPEDGDGEYLLVLTNLHWPTYTMDEKVTFIDALVELVESRPGLPVIWKMHHAETPPASRINQRVRDILERHPDAKGRIRFAHLDPELKVRTAAEIISGAKYVVSTVSTVLLDCEIHRRPTAVYACSSNDCLVKMIKSADFFGDGDSLKGLFDKGLRPIRTGKLRPYDNAAFRAALDATYRPSSITQADFLSLLLSQTFRDDFIARNMAAKDATIAALRKSDEAKGAVIEGIKAELAGAVRENGRMSAERDAARHGRDSLSGEMATLEGKLENAVRENGKIASERDAARDGRDSLSRENAALEVKLEEAVRENGKIAAERDAARDGRDALSGEIATLEVKLEEAVRENGKIAAERDAARDELAVARSERDATRGELAALKDKHDATRGELVALKGERDALQVELSKEAEESARLDAALAERLAVCANKDMAIDEYMRQIEAQNRDIAVLTDARGRLEERHDAVVAERDELRLQLSACQAKIEAQKNERDALTGNLAAMKSLVDERIAICNKTCADAKGLNARLVNEKAALQGKLGASQRQAASLQRKLDETMRNLDNVRREAKAFRDLQTSKSLRKRFNRLVKGLLPYGVTCTWKRMVYGIAEDRPLFAYPGFFKKCRRLLKFSLPYFAIVLFKRMRYGKSRR